MQKEKIIIEVNEEINLQKHLINLREFVEKRNIEGLDMIDLTERQVEEGKMAIGEILSSLTAIISAANNPLTELVKCLQVYIQSFRTSIEIKVGDNSIKIDSKKPEETEIIVSKILEVLNNSKK